MAIKYVDWRKPDNRVPYASDIRDEVESTWFNEEDDDFVTFLNEDNGKYAVYYKLAKGGALCSLVEHFDLYSRLVDNDDGLSDELYAVIAKRAIDCGFPVIHPPINTGLTWRELLDELKTIPPHQLDMKAWVYVHDDASMTSGEVAVTGLSAYDESAPIGEDNHLSISIND